MRSRIRIALATAAVVAAVAAAPATADPPPWSAAAFKHRGAHCARPEARPFFRRRLVAFDPIVYERCGPILEKIHRARQGLARWGGTNRHEDAQRYWRDYLRTAPRRLAECRAAAYRNESVAFDRDEDFFYDPEYPYGRPFDLKRDWPFLLGDLLGAYAPGLR